MQAGQHRRAAFGQMLLHAGAEGKVRSLGVQQRGEDAGIAAVRIERALQRGDHGRIDDVRLGPRQAQP